MAQEGHFGVNPKASTTPANEESPPLVPDKPADFSELRSQGVVLVDQVIDPLRVLLQDGRIVQLTGLDIPDLDYKESGEQAAQAFEWLKNTIEKKQVTLYQTKHETEGRRNRMGHYLGHIETREDKVWLQGAYLINGWAQVQPSPLHTEMALQMLPLEAQALTGKRGLWAEGYKSALTPETASANLNSWAIVEGTIIKASMVNNTIYLNFGEDWRKDFSIGLEPDIRRQFSKKQINPLDLQGQTVRVHGWIESYNGPFIRLSHAIWLEVLPDSTPAANLPPDN